MKANVRIMSMVVCILLLLLLPACGSAPVQEHRTTVPDEGTGPEATPSDFSGADGNEETGEERTMLQMRIGDMAVTVEWEDNASVQALKDLCRDTPLTIPMSMYGGFEQVGPIGTSLPRHDQQTTTEAGDIVLYAGDQIVVFYGSNSWSYTRLGHITDQDAAEMAELLGNGDVTITIGME